MSRSWNSGIIGVLVGAAAASAFFLLQRGQVAAIDSPPSSSVAVAPSNAVASDAVAPASRVPLSSPELVEVAAEPAPAAPPPAPPVAAELTVKAEPEPWEIPQERIPVPISVFEEKYAHATRDELRNAMEARLELLNQRKLAAFDARVASGSYERRQHLAGMGPQGQPGFSVKQTTGLMIRLGSTGDDPGHSQVTWLPYDEYPNLYDLQDEWRWLAQKVYSPQK
jgi:hypothetical protein